MLEIKNITKRYKDVCALQDVSFTMDHGVYALLGPNGAGKSTLMHILCDLLTCDDGEVLFHGKAIKTQRKTYLASLGYAPQQQGLYDEFTGLRFLTYMALLKDVKKKDIPDEVQRVARLVNMQDQLHKRCKAYSGGMKQRILVAQALLKDPELLLFDEPTAGLDPKERVSLRKVFEELGRDHTLLIATHVVSDIESIAKEVLFLKKGCLLTQGSVEELLKLYQKQKLEDLYLKLFQEDLR